MKWGPPPRTREDFYAEQMDVEDEEEYAPPPSASRRVVPASRSTTRRSVEEEDDVEDEDDDDDDDTDMHEGKRGARSDDGQDDYTMNIYNCPEEHKEPEVLSSGKTEHEATTELRLANMIRQGKLLVCDCGARLVKTSGCNWLKCSIDGCGIEWCWLCKRRKGTFGDPDVCPYMGRDSPHNSH
jgi:hypothetical protein